MSIKCTLLFQLATGTAAPNPSLRRIGGWSESFYFPGGSIAAANDAVNGRPGVANISLCEYRAGLLPTSAQIIGQRFQEVNPVGRSQSFSKVWGGGSGFACDIPQMALLTRIPAAASNNVRMYIIRGIPDQLVVDGEFAPTQAYRNAINRLFVKLSEFQMRVVVRGAVPNTVATIDNNGLVTFTNTRPTVNPGDRITFYNILNAVGDPMTATYVVEKLGDGALQLSIRGWIGSNYHGGTAVGTSVTYPALTNNGATIGRIIVKKVGRPFVGYRGRASTRKKRRQVA